MSARDYNHQTQLDQKIAESMRELRDQKQADPNGYLMDQLIATIVCYEGMTQAEKERNSAQGSGMSTSDNPEKKTFAQRDLEKQVRNFIHGFTGTTIKPLLEVRREASSSYLAHLFLLDADLAIELVQSWIHPSEGDPHQQKLEELFGSGILFSVICHIHLSQIKAQPFLYYFVTPKPPSQMNINGINILVNLLYIFIHKSQQATANLKALQKLWKVLLSPFEIVNSETREVQRACCLHYLAAYYTFPTPALSSTPLQLLLRELFLSPLSQRVFFETLQEGDMLFHPIRSFQTLCGLSSEPQVVQSLFSFLCGTDGSNWGQEEVLAHVQSYPKIMAAMTTECLLHHRVYPLDTRGEKSATDLPFTSPLAALCSSAPGITQGIFRAHPHLARELLAYTAREQEEARNTHPSYAIWTYLCANSQASPENHELKNLTEEFFHLKVNYFRAVLSRLDLEPLSSEKTQSLPRELRNFERLCHSDPQYYHYFDSLQGVMGILLTPDHDHRPRILHTCLQALEKGVEPLPPHTTELYASIHVLLAVFEFFLSDTHNPCCLKEVNAIVNIDLIREAYRSPLGRRFLTTVLFNAPSHTRALDQITAEDISILCTDIALRGPALPLLIKILTARPYLAEQLGLKHFPEIEAKAPQFISFLQSSDAAPVLRLLLSYGASQLLVPRHASTQKVRCYIRHLPFEQAERLFREEYNRVKSHGKSEDRFHVVEQFLTYCRSYKSSFIFNGNKNLSKALKNPEEYLTHERGNSRPLPPPVMHSPPRENCINVAPEEEGEDFGTPEKADTRRTLVFARRPLALTLEALDLEPEYSAK